MSRVLGYLANDARADAEWLLGKAHTLDPVGSEWSRLIRRSPRDKWKGLKNDVLTSMWLREAAEILLLFYEDLVERGDAEELPDFSDRLGYHPLVERLSFRSRTLDEDLVDLGVSPHPRVVLALEGETEEVHWPRVWSTLRLPDSPELIRVLKLGGVDKDPVVAGVLAAAPLLARLESNGFWRGTKPPTTFMIAADPEGKYYDSAVEVARTKRKILDAIEEAIKSQRAELDTNELETLVEIHTWGASCYEFAHFTDEELADGIREIHRKTGNLTRDELIEAIAVERARNKDIKEVWSRWEYKPSKVDLAHVLWPVLESKVKAALSGAGPVPEIADLLRDAYLTAQSRRYGSFVWPVKKN